MTSAAEHKWARGVVIQAFTAEVGRAPSTFEAQCIQAVGLLETSYGKGWKPPGQTSHNWGAVQLTKAQEAAGVPGFAYTDSTPDGKTYHQAFRAYSDDVAGCRDLVRQMTKQRPATWAAMQANQGTDAVSQAMFFEHYYGSQCPQALAKYGAAAKESTGFTGRRATTEAGKACEGECIARHAKTLSARATEIAQALGEPAPPRVGAGKAQGPAPSSSVPASSVDMSSCVAGESLSSVASVVGRAAREVGDFFGLDDEPTKG